MDMAKVIVGVVVAGMIGGIGYGAWYHYYGIDERSQVCTVSNQQVTLVKFNEYDDWTHYFVYGESRIQPSQTVPRERAYPVLNYYFDDNGRQFTVTWSEQSKSWVIGTVGGGWNSIDGYVFKSSQKIGSHTVDYDYPHTGVVPAGEHVFYLVGEPLVKARSNQSGPNNVFVLMPDRAKGKFGPYADTTMPMWVEGKPVFVGWKSKVEERGAERVTTNAYVFSWDGQEMPIDCEQLAKPVPPTKPGEVEAENPTYVRVVEPFDAPVCGGNVKIGLERRVVKRLVAGQDQTSETLVYTINGQRYPIGTVHVAPNANVSAGMLL